MTDSQASAAPVSRTGILLLVAGVIFIDMAVYSLVIPVLPSYIRLLGVDAGMLGVIFGMYPAMLFLFSIPMGLLSDRVGRRPVLIVGMVLLAASTALFGLAATVPALILARSIQGISAAATWSAGLALLADTYGQGELGEKMGVTMAAMSVGMVIGPVAGGYLYEYVGYTATFIIPSAGAALMALGLFLLPLPRRLQPAHRRRPALLPASGISLLAVYAAAVIGVAATYGILEPFLPVYLADTFAASPAVVGVVLGLLAFAAIVGQPIAGRLADRHATGRMLIVAGILVAGLALAAAMRAPDLRIVAGAVLLLGFALSIALIPTLPLMADLYRDEDAQGVAYGVYNSFFSVGLALGPFAGALLAGPLAVESILILSAVLLTVAGIVGLLAVLAVRLRHRG
ncbi:MFS transporter [Methanoculleus frigidifontis]|nr:MFS transporter [Methanoculleus sp. FWC-SCC1]